MASASPRSAISMRVAIGSALRPTRARTMDGCVLRSTPAGTWACVRSMAISAGPSIWPAGTLVAARAAAVSPCSTLQAAFARLENASVSCDWRDDGAGALSFARQHQRVGHYRGDRRIGIAAGIAHHLVQALRLAHGGELLDLAHEQAGRRTAVRRRWRELAHQDLELQIAQARGCAAHWATPTTSRLAVAREVPAQAFAGMPPVVAVRKPVGLSSKLAICASTGAAISTESTAAAAAQASARSVHWGRGPRSAAPADGARSRQAPPRRQPGGRRQ